MRVLIVGLGSIAKKHINAIRICYPDSTIVALRSGKGNNSIDGVHNIYGLEELTFLPDFAIISNSTLYHEKYIIELAKLKIPLFIEKPSLSSLKNTKEIINLIEKNKIVTYVACNLRFHPCILFLNNYLKDILHKVNEVSVYCGSYLPEWRPNQNFRNSYSVDSNLGGGVNLDLIHELDYITWIFGFPLEWKQFFSSKSTLKINSIDYANYILSYSSFNVSVILNYFRRDPKRTVEIVLDDSTINVDLINCNISNSHLEIIFSDENFHLLDTYKFQLQYFIEKLKKNEIPMNSLKDSIEVLKIAI